MLDSDASRLALERLFGQRPVANLDQLSRALRTDSRMSVFRRLSGLGYVSSYTHTGRYYTLLSVPAFDADGLWRYEGIGFSRDGTLKSTVKRLVDTSDAGRTQRELQLRLGVRVHNPLLHLAQSKQLGRHPIDQEFVYVAGQLARAKEQIARRRASGVAEATGIPPAIEIEVLVEVIHGARVPPPDATQVVARLAARGVQVPVAEVAAVLSRHGLGRKTARSRSPRSRR